MLRDITLGQHFPGESPVHRLDPRLKILLTIAYVVVLFIGDNVLGLCISVAFIVLMYFLAKIPPKVIWRNLKPLLPILIFTTVLNLFFNQSGQVLVSFWIVKITMGGVFYAIRMIVRIVCLVVGTGLLTYTTSPIVLTDAIERLLSPLSKLGFPAHELAMMMTIALRMIPTLIEETDKIMSAQKARGAELDTGGLLQRVRALVPVLIPLFLSAFRRADELATAMEARCYRGGDGRTRLRQLHITGRDWLYTAVCVLVLAAIVLSNRLMLLAGFGV
ncbi:energy-coupling factor transporter transmembrane protein EcfT [Ruminococcaceae bacterium OttesenSCG-928-D13]|nr:energy-coupling factor transporter transmembrane protein EcfT [Ruminococcaceae bacterium OttesenSCG-928-D13]